VQAAMAAGIPDIGENYAQEMADKATSLGAEASACRWHFIGQLQRNKVRLVAPHVAVWQTVDRAGVADEIAKRQPGGSVLVQLDLTGAPERGGCAPEDVAGLVDHCRSVGLQVLGLMAVGPPGPPEDSRPGFRLLASTADALDLPVRSMGMSADLEVAVEEGSTMVRIGRDLFGARPARQRRI